MMNLVRRSTLTLLFACCVSVAANGQNAENPRDLPNLYKVNGHLYRGGQPTEAGVRELAKIGVRTIIDLRGNDELSAAETRWANSSGIKFISIPLNNWFGPSDAAVAKAITAIDARSHQPVFIHCKRGSDRTGTVIAVYRITHDGWTGSRAIAEAKKFGLGWWQFWMKDYIDDYYRDFSKTHAAK